MIGRAFVAGALRYAEPPYYAVPVLFDCEQAVLRSLGVVAFLRKFYGIGVEQTFSGENVKLLQVGETDAKEDTAEK